VIRVELEAARRHVAHHRLQAALHHRQHHERAGVGRHDDLPACTQAPQGLQDEHQRRAARGADADCFNS